MATKPRKPKLLKYPKKPRQSASTAVLQKYLGKVKDIDRINRDRMNDYKKAVRNYEADKKKHAALVKAISGIGNASAGAVKTVRRKTVKKSVKRTAKKRTAKKRTTKRRRR